MRAKVEGKNLLFCEQKRSKKNFCDLSPCLCKARAQSPKSFLRAFFQKSAACLCLSSCAPALPAPDTAVPVTAYLPGPVSGVAAGAVPAAWWESFGSPALDVLVATGLRANPTIGEAAQNLAAAAESANAANGAYLPQIGVNPNVSRQAYPAGPNESPPYTIYSITGTISYDPGLFGARRYTFENGQALAEYQQAELDAAKQSLVGNIVAAAITEAGAEAQIATTAEIIAAEQRLLTLLNGEYADGAIPQLNILQQQSQILAIQATLPPLQTQADEARDRLAILTGRLPAEFVGSGVSLDGLAVPVQIPIALPSAYLASRPDIRAARAEVAAQNAALGIAVAHFYPDLSLSANGGYASETLNALFVPGAPICCSRFMMAGCCMRESRRRRRSLPRRFMRIMARC
jgi:NodT family efflux transporter outer membrane factor (OMF) lipoprotein